MKYISDEKRNEYVRIAYYYYKSGLTQEQIAEKLNLSRQRVNRILSQCLDLGIVQINIVGHEESYVELETKLETMYGLKAARIAGPVTEENAYDSLGRTAARYLSGVIQNGDVIGFSRGSAMSALVGSLPHIQRADLKIAQLMGSWNSRRPHVNVDDIVHRAAESLAAATTMLYAPVVVNQRELRDSIVNEPYFQEAYAVIRSCTIAAVGIGALGQSLPRIIPSMEEKEYRLYCDRHAVGEVCAHFFDREGRPVTTEFDDRTISVQLADFLAIPLRIGVAGLPIKLPAIQGALNGGYINVLVTDLDTAESLINSPYEKS